MTRDAGVAPDDLHDLHTHSECRHRCACALADAGRCTLCALLTASPGAGLAIWRERWPASAALPPVHLGAPLTESQYAAWLRTAGGRWAQETTYTVNVPRDAGDSMTSGGEEPVVVMYQDRETGQYVTRVPRIAPGVIERGDTPLAALRNTAEFILRDLDATDREQSAADTDRSHTGAAE